MVTKMETLDAADAKPQAAYTPSVAKIDIYNKLDDVSAEWAELSALAKVSPYQSHQLLSVWVDTIGRDHQLEPFVVVARDHAGRPRALLPFAIDQRGPLRIATFLGGRESNFNLALIHPDARFDENDIRALLRAAAQTAPGGVDLYYLRNQPTRFDDFDNPLICKNARPSASAAYGVTLPRSEEELLARVSKDTRKKLRKKEAKLAELGVIHYEHRVTGERARDVLRALIEQKSARLAEMGVDGLFNSEGAREMVCRLAEAKGDGAIELHALSVNERIVATYAGFLRGGRFSAMLNSYEMDETIARSSPGDLLLHALMRDLVARGMTHFDLGTGEARYKSSVCDEIIELRDTLTPTTWKGYLAAPLFAFFLRAKRRVKQSPTLSHLYVRIRRIVHRDQ